MTEANVSRFPNIESLLSGDRKGAASENVAKKDEVVARLSLNLYLEDFIGKAAKEEVIYFPNPGNAGDALIQVGAYQCLKRAGLRYRTLQKLHDADDRIVILGGGANLTNLYKEVRGYMIEDSLIERCRQLIILPSTIRGNEDLISMFTDKVVVFCRDIETYSHVLKHAKTDQVHLAHDTALSIDLERFNGDTGEMSDLPGLFEHTIKGREKGVNQEIALTGLFFRTDGEASDRCLAVSAGINNLDISKLFAFGTREENALKSSWCLFEAIKRANKVQTDRLHVGIGAALLGVGCTLYDNSYGKNRAIYEHSIRKIVSKDEFKFV